jgi:V/A-type H+-transporting ATPase subunit I
MRGFKLVFEGSAPTVTQMLRLRPTQARWFETYVPREHTVRATELLANTGMVQLELDPRAPETVDTGKLRFFVERFRRLAETHREDLPSGGCKPTALVGNPLHLANVALHRMRVWSARVDYLHEHLAQLRAELDYLQLLNEGLEALQAAGVDLGGLPRHTRFLCKCLFACPKGCCEDERELQSMVHVIVPGPHHDFPLLVGRPEEGDIVRRMVLEKGCEQVGIPSWLSRDRDRQREDLETHRLQATARIADLDRELEDLRRDPQIAEACANLDTLAWYLDHSARYLGERDLCHVTGWTTARDPELLQRTLWLADIQAIVRFPEPPAFANAPVTTLETWWAQPFRPLVLMWGTPGREEIDPSGLLALVVPLLFGYMFPDVGHGLMLVAFALLFSRRWPQVRFLLPCGVASMGFGVVFGDVFGFGDVIPALWLKPLDEPLLVLALPLLFGILLMLLGLVFAGVEAHWRGRLRRWLQIDAAVLVLYVLLLLAPLVPEALWLVPLALLHYFTGTALGATDRLLVAMATALGELLLSVFELAMNTLSFLRVGAFALAHAALSHAVITLAGTVEQPVFWLLILVLGNLFAVVLEGLIVFVQTTRLVLFEFFIRFLRADGRIFQPLRRPPAAPV